MPKVAIVKHIQAPQQQVWEFISDIEKAPEWAVMMKSLVETTESPVRKGTVYREVSRIGPKKSETTWKVTHFEEPHFQVHECDEPDFKASLIIRVEDNGDGTSTLFYTTLYELMPHSRSLGWLTEMLFIKNAMNKKLHQSIENCKREIEDTFS